MGKVFVICAVATQGCSDNGENEWVTEYKISTSTDNIIWSTYQSGVTEKVHHAVPG
jgi:hypothetical protein